MPDSAAPVTPFRQLATVAMNLICHPLLIVYTLLSALAGVVLIPVTALIPGWSPGRATRFWIWFYGWLWALLFRPFLRIRREGVGVEPADAFRRPSVVVLNHQSFFDTYLLGCLPLSNISLAVRAWPFKMLWFAPFMRLAGYFDVESLHHKVSQQRVQELLSEGTHVVFFPEGHRSRDGSLGRFYTGAFRFAVAAGVPVVPVCISGSGRLLPPGRWWFRPATVTLKVLKPLDPADFEGTLSHRELMNHVRCAMASELEGLEREGGCE